MARSRTSTHPVRMLPFQPRGTRRLRRKSGAPTPVPGPTDKTPRRGTLDDHPVARHSAGVGAAGKRVAVFQDKRPETVATLVAVALVGGIAVPLNPALKPHQVVHVLRDSSASGLSSTAQRLKLLQDNDAMPGTVPHQLAIAVDDVTAGWQALADTPPTAPLRRLVDTDPALNPLRIGSTGPPNKGVLLSHRNLVAGVESVLSYLANTADDRILAALPMTFDSA